MRNYIAKNVDDYITNAPKEAQPLLNALRATIKKAVPTATEGISWGIPFYKYHGLLAGFSAFKKHITFGLCFTFTQEDRDILEAKGYATGKKTVQIKFDQKIPAEITKMIKAQAKTNEAKRTAKKTAK